MSETLGIVGYVPEVFFFRRQMLALIHTMWNLYLGLVVLLWAVLPWRIGWHGVAVALWVTLWCAYTRGMLWLTDWGRRQPGFAKETNDG